MDLSAWLLRHTPPRPLVVTAPGGTAPRLTVEKAIRERGWQPATSPAEANLLVVAGAADHTLEPYLRRIWDSTPAPRTRADIADPGEATRQLDSALSELRDLGRQREQAAARPDLDETATHDPQHDMAATEHHDGDAAGGGHGQHGGHDHHGHHMGGMQMPGGIPMADRADDRDGLKLDQLHVPLGPVLPLWPAGLIVHTRLQGDVIQHAAVELLDSGHDSFWAGSSGAHQVVARRLDSSARLLALAGWTDASVLAQRLRDEALDESRLTALVPRLRKWAERVRRSRTLRWLLADVGSTPDDPPTPPPLAGDALARLYRWLDVVIQASDQLALPDRRETQWTVDALPALLEGTEVATARLVVASLDPDLDLLAHREAHHG